MDRFHLTFVMSYRASAGFQSTWVTYFRGPNPRPRPHRRSSHGLRVEQLEVRQLLSADPIAFPFTSAKPLASSPTPTGLTPAQVRQAYGVNNITFANGSIVGDGSGQTIAIVVAYHNPYIASDLQVFNQQYGLPNSPFEVIKQTPSIKTNGGWGLETALDVQWAHAIAPGAKILLLEAKSDLLSDLMTMVNVARQQPDVVTISMSWGMNEFRGEKNYNSYFTTPAGHQGITFVAASGDDGAWLGASFPAISPNVLGVGGTQLFVSPDGTYLGESAWAGSGGGYSKFMGEPAYQRSAQNTGLRSSPDVSWNAAISSGVSVYSTLSDTGPGGWFAVGGTSAGAPAWAAIIAIADQGRAINGQGSLAGAQSVLYSLSRSDFHDITAGRNGYSAGAGYDVVTGLGSPYADRVVAGLVVAYNAGNGNHAVAASLKRIRRLNRIHAKRHTDLTDDLDLQFGLGIFAPGSSTLLVSASRAGSSAAVQVTTINANQAMTTDLVSRDGRLIERVAVPIPTLDIAAISAGQTIAPFTTNLLSRLGAQPDVQRIGQGDDLEDSSARPGESPLPSVVDPLDRRNPPAALPEDGVPADLAPQVPPAPPLKDLELLPTIATDEVGAIIAHRDRDLELEWSADMALIDHFVAVSRRDLGEAADADESEESADGARLVAAAAVTLAGTQMIRIRGRWNRFQAAPEHDATDRPRLARRRRTRVSPFRYLLERGR